MANDILARFWDYFIVKTKSYNMSDYTARQYVRHVKAYIKHFPDLRLKHHTGNEVEKYLQQMALASQQEMLEFTEVVEALKIFFQDVVRFPWAGTFPWTYWCDLASTLQQTPRQPQPDRGGFNASSMDTVPQRLSHCEVQKLFSAMNEPLSLLMARLLYGCGLRAKEVIRLRVFDVDFTEGKLLIRNADGSRDRIVPVADELLGPLRDHIINIEILFAEDLARGFAGVYLPAELQEKYPNASRELRWQYLFSADLQTDSQTGKTWRHHVEESSLEEAIQLAGMEAGLNKKIDARSLRDAFVAHLIDSGHDIYAVGKLLGEEDISSVMIMVPRPVQDYFTVESNTA